MTPLRSVEVAQIEELEAVELFMRCSELNNGLPGVESEVKLIVKELGYLALVVSLAGSCWQPLAARLGTWSWHRHLYITASLASSLVRILIITDHTPTEMYRDHR